MVFSSTSPVSTSTFPGELKLTATSCLMDDVLPAGEVSARVGRNHVALYANPFLDGKPEALVIDTDGLLTQLRRAPDDVGWLQTSLGITAREVVTAVSAHDLGLYAVYIAQDGSLGALQLVLEPGGGRWQPQTIRGAAVVDGAYLAVYYKGRDAYVSLFDRSSQHCVRVSLSRGHAGPSCSSYLIGMSSPVDVISTFRIGSPCVGYAMYADHPNDKQFNVVSFDDNTTHLVSKNATQLVGLYEVAGMQNPHVGCIYLDSDGNLCTSNAPPRGGTLPATSKTPLGLARAVSWTDANGMIHVYGIDKDDVLRVIHQVAWEEIEGRPVWSTTKDETGKLTPACLSVQLDVVSFDIDPFPDYLPNQLSKLKGKAGAEQYLICTQDLITARWTREQVRLLPDHDTEPKVVTHYVSEVVLTDQRGSRVADQRITVTADSLVEVMSGGASYLVGDGHTATLAVGVNGKLTIAIDADSLAPPALQLGVLGASVGLSIQPAADVHNYLEGKGTLASQRAPFGEGALKESGILNQGVTNHEVTDTVHSVSQSFAAMRNSGKLVSRLVRDANGVAPPIHGFSFGIGADGRVRYLEHASPEHLADHIKDIEDRPDYGGLWEDFASFASDLWEGIKTGAITVAHVLVEAATTIYFKIGEATVKVVGLVIDTVKQAVQVAEACIRQVVATVEKVVDWLKALFNFKDIWDTTKALREGIPTLLGYGKSLIKTIQISDDWFRSKQDLIKTTFTKLRSDFGVRQVGDFQNQTPQLTDRSGGVINSQQLRDQPQANWMLGQVHKTATRSPELLAAAVAGDNALFDIVTPLMTAFDSSGISEAFAGVVHDVWALVTNLLSPSDPEGTQGANIGTLLDKLEQLALAMLGGLDNLLAALRMLLLNLADAASDLFKTPLLTKDNPLNTLFRWIQTKAKADTIEDLTVGGLFFLTAGFFVTTTHKLIHGVDSVPFPNGFPAIPAPPGHPAYTGPYRPSATANQDLINLQIACGACGLVAGGIEAIADLIVVFNPTRAFFTLDRVVGTLALVFSNIMWTTVLWCPPVTGNPWVVGTEERTSDWTNAWIVWLVMSAAPLTQVGWSWATSFNETPTTALTKNIANARVGPVVASIMSGVMLVMAGVACNRNGVNSYAFAANMIGFVGGSLQALRLNVVKPPLPPDVSFYERAWMIAVVDLVTLATSSTMVIVAAAWPGPHIAETTVERSAGEPLGYWVEATGGDKVFNLGLKDWTILSTNLPGGVEFTKGNLLTTGPLTKGEYYVMVQCTDSFGPPKYSNEAKITIIVS